MGGSVGTTMSVNSNANGAAMRGAAARRGGGEGTQISSVITSAAWDVRVTRCDVAKADLNEVRIRGELRSSLTGCVRFSPIQHRIAHVPA